MSGLRTEQLPRGKSLDISDLKLRGPLFGNKRASPALHLLTCMCCLGAEGGESVKGLVGRGTR